MGVRRSFALVTAAAAVVLATSLASPASAAGGDWPQYMGGTFHNSAGHDGAITPARVPSLRAVWHAAAGTNVDASVTVVGNRAYFTTRGVLLYAVNATTGAVIWKKQLDKVDNTYCTRLSRSTGTPAVLPDPVTHALTVYAPGAHRLYALDAATGKQRWSRAIGPATAEGKASYFNWSSPTVANGRIFMGLAANCDSHPIRGGLVSLNQHTGALQHTWYDTPAGTVGASVWASAASDGASVWVSTGNPDPNGSGIYHAQSVVRLSAATLAEQDWWTATEPQDADRDFGSSPVLFTATVGGVATPMVGACNKNGIFYAWRRTALAAGPVWQRTLTPPNAWPTPCLGSGAVEPGSLYVAAGPTTIGADSVAGAVRSLDPATGAVRWERPLPCGVVGTLTVDDVAHVLAVPLFCDTGNSGVAFFRSTDGTSLGTLSSPSRVFAQPVFAAGRLYVATEGSGVTAYTG